MARIRKDAHSTSLVSLFGVHDEVSNGYLKVYNQLSYIPLAKTDQNPCSPFFSVSVRNYMNILFIFTCDNSMLAMKYRGKRNSCQIDLYKKYH